MARLHWPLLPQESARQTAQVPGTWLHSTGQREGHLPFAARTLKCHRSIPGHSIAAVREPKSSLWATAGGKGPHIRPKNDSRRPGDCVEQILGFAEDFVGDAARTFGGCYVKRGSTDESDKGKRVAIAEKRYARTIRTRITTCYPDRVETGPGFVPVLPHVAAHSCRWASSSTPRKSTRRARGRGARPRRPPRRRAAGARRARTRRRLPWRSRRRCCCRKSRCSSSRAGPSSYIAKPRLGLHGAHS